MTTLINLSQFQTFSKTGGVWLPVWWGETLVIKPGHEGAFVCRCFFWKFSTAFRKLMFRIIASTETGWLQPSPGHFWPGFSTIRFWMHSAQNEDPQQDITIASAISSLQMGQMSSEGIGSWAAADAFNFSWKIRKLKKKESKGLHFLPPLIQPLSDPSRE